MFTADLHGWTRFSTMQNHVNLLHREEEHEMLPLCRDQGIAVLPWSPLARGRLTRDPDAATARQDSDDVGKGLYDAPAAADRAIIAEIAGNRGVPRAQVVLAWIAAKPEVAAPIIGASKPGHLDEAVAALDLVLTADEAKALESLYTPHPRIGFT